MKIPLLTRENIFCLTIPFLMAILLFNPSFAQEKEETYSISLVKTAEEGKEIIGFVSTSINKNTGYGYDYAWISDAFVKNQYRGRGIMSKLLTATISLLRKQGIKSYKISSDISNKEAVALWKKMGFKKYEITLRKKIK